MKRSDLAPKLQEEYGAGKECGVTRAKAAGYENIWFVVPSPPPRELPKKLPAAILAKANQIISALPSLDKASELDLIISHLFQRREAVQSSRMEGTWSTIDDVLTPGELFDAKTGRTERASVLGYANALANEIKTATKTGISMLTTQLVQKLHKQIMEKDPNFHGQAGEIRSPGKPRSIVFIGGTGRKEDSIFNPPPPEHTKKCLEHVMNWMADEELCELGNAGLGLSLPIRLAIAHAHFEAVHPFSDGNGRVGRAVMMLQMACEGKLPIYISGYIEKEKRAYISSLEHAQKKLNYGPMVEFVSEALVAAYQEAEETKRSIEELPEQWLERASFRGKSAGERALIWLLTNPIFTANQLRMHLQVSAPAAQRAVSQLVEKRIVRERTGHERNRVFAAEEIIALLSREFGENTKAAIKRARTLLEQAP